MNTLTVDSDLLLEACPVCDMEDVDCVWCDGLLLVPHCCDG